MITMYPGMVNSPKALLSAAIAADSTSLVVDDGAKLPAAPNLAVLGVGDDAETILYTVKSGNVISGITRAVQGAAKMWPENTIVARNFTEKDFAAIKGNIEALFDVNEIDRCNLIINGNFDVWQRGTSQTTSGYGSDDRWNNLSSGSTKTHSQQAFTVGQTDVPNNPTCFSRTVVSSVVGAGNIVAKYQTIENVNLLSNKTVTLSFWAKADASKNIAIEFSQIFGTGGSSSVLGIGVQKVALTTTWAKYSITATMPSVSGKTIGANNHTRVMFWFDAGSDLNVRTNSLGNQSGTFEIAQVQLNFGSVALPFEHRSIAVERHLCKYYGQELNPNNVDWISIGNGIAQSATYAYVHVPIETMRVSPTITLSGAWYLERLGTYIAITTLYPVGVTYDVLMLSCTVASGLTGGSVYNLKCQNGAKNLFLDAEL